MKRGKHCNFVRKSSSCDVHLGELQRHGEGKDEEGSWFG